MSRKKKDAGKKPANTNKGDVEAASMDVSKTFEIQKASVASKTLHLSMKTKQGKWIVCCTKKGLKDDAPSFELTVEAFKLINCRNCFQSAEMKNVARVLGQEVYDDVFGKNGKKKGVVRPEKKKGKKSGKKKSEPTKPPPNKELIPDKPAALTLGKVSCPKDHVIFYYAATKRQTPLMSIIGNDDIAGDLGRAKEQLRKEFVRVKNKDKLRKRWEADGEVVITRFVPRKKSASFSKKRDGGKRQVWSIQVVWKKSALQLSVLYCRLTKP